MPGFAFSAAFARNLRGGDPLDEDSSFESVPRPARAPPVETAASGTSDFASPRTASSGSTVGGSSADSPVSLVLIGHSNQVCCGVIGNRSKGHFCTALVGTCSTKAHANNKFNVRDASWYARTYGRRGGALLHVSCPDDSVKRPEDREAFLKHEKPIDVWRGIFTAIQTDDAIVINTSSSEGGTDVSEMGSPSPRSVQFTRAATGLETPRPATIGRAVKRRVIRGSVDVSSLETVQDIEYEDGVPIPEGQDWDKAIGTMLAEWSKVGANFEKLKDMFIAMGVEFQDLNDGVVKDFDLIEEHSSLVDGKIHLLKERMGHDSAASDGGSKTVWNAIAELQADLVIHNKMFADLASGLDARFAAAESLSSSVKDLEEDYNASMNNLDLVLAEFNKRVTALERPVKTVVGRFSQGSTSMFTKQDVDNDTINDLKVRIAELERIVSVMKTVQPDANDVKSVRLLGQDLEVLGNRLGKLSTEGRNGEAQRARDWDGGFSDVSGFRRDKRKYGDAASAEDELQEVVEHFRNEINFLRGKVRALETPHRGQTVEFNGRKFTSIDDCREFLRITKLDAGVCLDLLTALLLMGSKGHSGKELSDERYSAKRMDTSVRINDVLAAMDQARPPKLYAKGGKGDCVAHAEGFGAIPSIKDWYGSGVDGIKHNLTTELRSYLNGIMGALNNQSGEGVELARHLNRQVISQWNDFVSFMEQSQTKLVEVAKFSDKAAWKLIGRYGVAFFEAMRPYRSAASLLENPQSLDDQAAILWAILQCHRTVDEFMHVGWEGHPAIVREMSLFMLTERVDPSQVAKVMEQNEALVVQVSSLKSSLKKLEETVTAQKRALDSLSNEVKQIKKPRNNGGNAPT